MNQPITALNSTALPEAILTQQDVIVKLLVEKYKADVNIADPLGKTPLHVAASTFNDEMVEYLISQGAHINALTSGKETPVMKACMAGCHSIVKTLLFQYKCDITPKNTQGKSILDLLLIYMGKDTQSQYVQELRKLHPAVKFEELISYNKCTSDMLSCLRSLKDVSCLGDAGREVLRKLQNIRKEHDEQKTSEPRCSKRISLQLQNTNSTLLDDENDERPATPDNTTTYLELNKSIECHSLLSLESHKLSKSSQKTSFKNYFSTKLPTRIKQYTYC